MRRCIRSAQEGREGWQSSMVGVDVAHRHDRSYERSDLPSGDPAESHASEEGEHPTTIFSPSGSASAGSTWSRRGALRAQEVETPSWAYGNSGTRFAVFAQPGVPRDPFEKLEDAAEVHRHTGVDAVGRAAHPVGPRRRLRRAPRARRRPRRCGSVRSTRTSSRSPSTSSAASATPRRPCAGARSTTSSSAWRSPAQAGSTCISLWLADGTNYAGQDSFAARRARLVACLRGGLRGAAPTAWSCWSSTSSTSPRSTPPTSPTGARRSCSARRSASAPKVLVDLGHHAQGVNIEQIVSLLARRGPARRLPLQRPQVRRRRPDRRLDRSVPAVPRLRRARAAQGRSSAACGRRSTSRTTSSRRSRR